MTYSVLLIDDDPSVLASLDRAFRRADYSVVAASTGRAGIEAYSHDATDLVVLDLNLPDIGGLDVLAELRKVDPDATVIVLTGRADVTTAVEAMRAGAENFLPKPVDLGHLYAAADRACEKIELRRRTRYLETRDRDESGSSEFGGGATGMSGIEEKVRLLAPQDTSVLILGETGTGKSWLARRIHTLSARESGSFVEVNAAALDATFLASELFGHEKGAFTDAKTLKRGLFEVADGGTLFLDEIGDLAPDLQPRLLHAIETRRFRRVGGTRDIESDVRLVAATNRDLRKLVADGSFREDLYYRLAVMPLVLPPLRERGSAAIAALAESLLDRIGSGIGPRRSLSAEAMRLITGYPWPGNIRELRNVLERASILAQDVDEIRPSHLPPEFRHRGSAETKGEGGTPTLQELERRHIRKVLEETGGNRSEAARVLGISRVGLYKKLKRMDESGGGG